MSRPIDRAEFFNRLSGVKTFGEVFAVIQDMMESDTAPQAKWIKDEYGEVICSRCGGIRRDNRIGHIEWCNCCGCRMEDAT